MWTVIDRAHENRLTGGNPVINGARGWGPPSCVNPTGWCGEVVTLVLVATSQSNCIDRRLEHERMFSFACDS